MNENQAAEVIEIAEPENKQSVRRRTERIAKAVISAGAKVKGVLSKVKNEKVATCVAAAGGAAASGAGATAAVIGTTTMVTTAGASAATITAAGTAIGGAVGGVTGGVLGSFVGIAAGPLGACAGTIPGAIAGGTTGASVGAAAATTVAGWLGIPMATTVAVTTTPVWAIPVAAGGALAVLGAGVVYWNRRKKRLAA